MANGLDVKVRDYGREIAADDPLMELSRIMGFDRPAPETEPADPQLAIEDTFSMDLERELALEESQADSPSALDAEFSTALEDELSEALQLADDAPSVVPSLEDELTALLGNEPQAEPGMQWARAEHGIAASAAQAVPQDLNYEDDLDLPKLELSSPASDAAVTDWPEAPEVQAEPTVDIGEPWLDDSLEEPVELELTPHTGITRSEAVASLEDFAELDEFEPLAEPEPSELAVARAGLEEAWRDHGPVSPPAATLESVAVEPAEAAFDGEPWSDIDSGDDFAEPRTETESVETEAVHEAEPHKAASTDWVLNEMNRVSVVTPAAASSQMLVADDASDTAVDDFEFDFEGDETSPPETDADYSESKEELPDAGAVTWQPKFEAAQASGRDFGRMLARTAPEPVVAAAEPMQDSVTQTDDFEIPDFDFNPEPQEAAASAGALGEYEPEYAGYEPKVEKKAASQVKEHDFDFEAILNEQWSANTNGAVSGLGVAAGLAAASALQPKLKQELDADLDFQPFGGEAPAFPEPGFDPPAQRRASWLVPALFAGVAILGGGIYYAYSGGSSSASANGPVLVKADSEPVKIAPANPGGKSVPDQDKAVYDKVDGGQAALPSQGTLVSDSEEPVDIASVTPEAPVETVASDGAVKSEARVDADASADAPAPASAETAAVTPKKVRTFIVKPDGSLVERPAEAAVATVAEKPVAVAPAKPAVTVAKAAPAKAAPAPEAVKPAVEAAKPVAVVAKPVVVAPKPVVAAPQVKTVAAVKPAPAAKPVAAEKPAADVAAEPAEESIAKLAAADPVAVKAAPADAEAANPAPAIKVVKTKKIKAPAAEKVAAVAAQDGGAPVLESRPADQPVTIVGKTGGQKAAADETLVASADPAPAPASGSYSIQIASTPSPEAAKSTYAALSRKFGGVIGGKGVNILKAEVDGKGTVYRVRIPAGSKQAATSMCAKYKSSGGNCFVTK